MVTLLQIAYSLQHPRSAACTPAGLYSKPQNIDYAHARKEFETTCFTAIRDLLNKTGVKRLAAASGATADGTVAGQPGTACK